MLTSFYRQHNASVHFHTRGSAAAVLQTHSSPAQTLGRMRAVTSDTPAPPAPPPTPAPGQAAGWVCVRSGPPALLCSGRLGTTGKGGTDPPEPGDSSPMGTCGWEGFPEFRHVPTGCVFTEPAENTCIQTAGFSTRTHSVTYWLRIVQP